MTDESVVRYPARCAGKWTALLALVLLALAGSAAHAQTRSRIYAHPDPASGRTFYPVVRAHLLDRFAPNAAWSGEARRAEEDAVPGLLRLADMPSGGQVFIDLRAFATTGAGETFVQVLTSPSPTLVFKIPGSAKCPVVYSPQTFQQFGTNIRTHWAIMSYQPGTTFTLTVAVECRNNATGQLVTHQDVWTWKIVATPESLRAVLAALHGYAIGTAGIPPIVREAAYDALIAAAERIQARIRAGDNVGAKAAIDAMDQLVVNYTSTGIIAAPEFPADSWIRVELEYLRSQLP